jgi:tetratricopeptide (TPR) repeat protein
LFGEVGTSPEILSHEPFLERARLQREQEQDGPARLAMGAYLVARLVDKLLTLPYDNDGADGFAWQLEAVRRHIGELPGNSPESAHLSGIVATVSVSGPPRPNLWKNLTAYAYFLEHEGRLEESLEMLSLAARAEGSNVSITDYTAYALFAARLNRQLAKWDRANACYSAAEESGNLSGDAVAVLRGRLGKGAVHRGQGNYPLARSVAEAVLRDASQLGLADAQALAYADLGTIYTFQGLPLEALKAHFQAFRITRDPIQRMRTLSDLAIDLYAIGAYDAARLAFDIVIKSNTSRLVRLNALLELMDLESLVENRVAFERCRNSIEESAEHMSPSMATDYQFKLGTGFARFGQLGRARQALEVGLKLAEAHRLNAWYFKIEEALKALVKREQQSSAPQPVSALSQTQEVHDVMAGLREYASSAT